MMSQETPIAVNRKAHYISRDSALCDLQNPQTGQAASLVSLGMCVTCSGLSESCWRVGKNRSMFGLRKTNEMVRSCRMKLDSVLVCPCIEVGGDRSLRPEPHAPRRQSAPLAAAHHTNVLAIASSTSCSAVYPVNNEQQVFVDRRLEIATYYIHIRITYPEERNPFNHQVSHSLQSVKVIRVL